MTSRFVIPILQRSLQTLSSKNYLKIHRITGVESLCTSNGILWRPYSERSTEINMSNKALIPLKKNRPRRKKTSLEKTVVKSGFWNVVALATAEEYDLDAMYKSLVNNENYKPSSLFETLHQCDTNFEFLHAVARYKVDNETRELFIFREGSFVVWNVSDLEIRNILSFVQNFEIHPYSESIVKNETEVMPYTYSINSNRTSLLQNGNICLTQDEEKTALDKYTYSNGMIASVKLGVWEALLDEFIESIEPVTVDLKLGKRITITREELLKKTGELYALKHRINLSSDLLDVPDFYWEREELEHLYLNTVRYFSVPKRTKVINDKLNHCIELVELLSSHLSDKHHVRLEWMVIILIAVEVLFEVLRFL